MSSSDVVSKSTGTRIQFFNSPSNFQASKNVPPNGTQNKILPSSSLTQHHLNFAILFSYTTSFNDDLSSNAV
jgi:hypothetical protein